MDYFSVSKSTSAGNSPHPDFGLLRVWILFVQQQLSYQSRQQWHIHLDFSWFPRLFSSLPVLNKDNNQHWSPLTCHLGGCVGQPPIQMLFFFPTGGSKEERCGRISRERPFLYVSHTIVCLSVEGRPSGHGGWQGKSLCTCSPTQRHRVTTGSDTRINLYRTLCLITWEIKQVRLY